MNWIDAPESSTIARFAYDKERMVLAIEFQSGGHYEYYDVPEAVFEAMMRASSRGQFHAQNVKNNYRYARI